MGYAGRMLAKHDPWLNFGLWAVLVGLLNFSVICGLKQEQVSLLLAIPAMAVSFVCSAIVLASFFIGAKQQSYFNRHKVELELNNKEEWLLHAGAFIITALIGICIIIALGSLLWYSISCVTDWGKKGLFFILLLFLISIYFFFLWRRRSNEKTKLDETQNKNNMDRSINFHQGNQYERSQETSSYVDESRPATIAIIYRSEMDYISRCIHDYPNIETGGQLFGFITETGAPVVCYAIGPGPNANHQSTFFNQDTEYLQNTYNKLNRRYGLRYIGEWHSHHQLGLAKPSGHDASTIVHGMQRSNFRHFLLCIGNCDNHFHSTLNAFTFHINDRYHYYHAPWKIIEMDSPYRSIIDRELEGHLFHPNMQNASHGSNYIQSETGAPIMTTPNYNDEYWLNNKANNLVLKSIIEFLTDFDNGDSSVKPQLDSQKHVHLLVQRRDRQEHIVFGDYFPNEAPQISISGEYPINNSAEWYFDGAIYRSFTTYYNSLFKKEDIILAEDPIESEK